MVKQREDADNIAGKVFNRDAYLRELVYYKEYATKKKAKLKQPFTLKMMLDGEQEQQLTKWMRIGWDLRSKGIRYKEEYDEGKPSSELLSGSQLQALLPEWKKQHPKFAELPAEAAQQILDNCVRDLVRCRTSKTSHRLLSKPPRSFRLTNAVHFITAEADFIDYSFHGFDTLDLLINTRMIRLPKLGAVKVTGSKKLLKWIRRNNIHISCALIWQIRGGEWRIRVVKYQHTERRMVAPGPNPSELLQAVRDIVLAAMRKEGSDAKYIASSVLLKELVTYGIELSTVKLSRAMKPLGVTVKRMKFRGVYRSWYSADDVVDAHIRRLEA